MTTLTPQSWTSSDRSAPHPCDRIDDVCHVVRGVVGDDVGEPARLCRTLGHVVTAVEGDAETTEGDRVRVGPSGNQKSGARATVIGRDPAQPVGSRRAEGAGPTQ